MSLGKEETVCENIALVQSNWLFCLWVLPSEANENEGEMCISGQGKGKDFRACPIVTVKVKAAYAHEKRCCSLAEVSQVAVEKGKEGNWMRRH